MTWYSITALTIYLLVFSLGYTANLVIDDIAYDRRVFPSEWKRSLALWAVWPLHAGYALLMVALRRWRRKVREIDA
jgi:hypothetical protein